MKRSYKFLLRPTSRQDQALRSMLDDHRALYNAALQERREAYQHPSRTIVRYGAQSGQLRDIRTIDVTGQGRWSFSSQQATLRRLNKAFIAFFRRVKAGQTPGYPRFKGVVGSTRWNSPRTETGAAGTPPRTIDRSGCGCKVWGTYGCTSTAR